MLSVGDRLRLADVEDVTVSSEGRFVAYTVRRVRNARQGADAHDAVLQRHIYVASVSGREPPRLLTRGAADAHSPAWHPDSDQLAFVRSVNGTPQIFILSLSGGAPYQLTDVPHGAADPQWDPEGQRVLFASQVPASALRPSTPAAEPSERPGRVPQDTMVTAQPDTLIVLRHAVTLDPVDTLAARPDGGLAPRAQRPPVARLDTLTTTPVDSLAGVMDSLRVRRDTLLQVPPVPTAPDPDGSLLQVRRWLARSPATAPDVLTHPLSGASATASAQPLYQHYFVVSVPPSIARETPERPTPRRVTSGWRTYSDATWLPLGLEIVVSASPPSAKPIDRVAARNLYLVSVRRGSLSRLLYLPGYALRAPRVTPDGTNIAFFARALDDPSAQTEIGLVPLDGRTSPSLISTEFDREPETLQWSPNGWHLYTTAASGGDRPLFRFAPFAQPDSTAQTPRPERLSTSRDSFVVDASMQRPVVPDQLTAAFRHVEAFAVTDATVLYAARSLTQPPEVYSNTVSFQRERRISSLHTAWADARTPPMVDTLKAFGPDSVAVYGRLMQRPTPERMQRPLLVDVATGAPSLDRWHARHVLAARGFAVLVAAPRRTPGYGTALPDTARADAWNRMRDLLALADSAAARPGVDSTRQVLLGHDTGAALAAWTASQADRFRAVILDGGALRGTPPVGTGRDSLRMVRALGGMPWEGPLPPPHAIDSTEAAAFLKAYLPRTADAELPPSVRLQQRTPLTYAHHIRSPLLLMHTQNADGHRIAEQMYRRLKVLRRPVEWVRYPAVTPRASVGPTLDRLLRTYEFAARFTNSVHPSRRPPPPTED